MTSDPKSLAHLVPHQLLDLRPYQPGKPTEELERELGITGAIKVASNENPLGPSPRAVEAATRALREVHLYPDGGAFRLRQRLAEELGIPLEQLIFGAGSNELVGLIIRTFCRPGQDAVLVQRHAFVSYRLQSVAHGVEFVESDVNEVLGCDVDALLGAITERTKVIFVANPNNPTGSYTPKAEFERLLDGVPENVLVVVDEAYHEYAIRAAADYPDSRHYLSESRPLLITLRTFSKIHGLAGLRIGYGVCDARLASFVDRVRRPFNTTSIGQAAALAALDDPGFVERSAKVARDGIAALSEAARAAGVKAYPSVGNFTLIDVGRDAGPVHDAMQRAGVIVRPMQAWGLPSCLRISVGTPEEMARTCDALRAAL